MQTCNYVRQFFFGGFASGLYFIGNNWIRLPTVKGHLHASKNRTWSEFKNLTRSVTHLNSGPSRVAAVSHRDFHVTGLRLVTGTAWASIAFIDTDARAGVSAIGA